jgi:hypothetical protein
MAELAGWILCAAAACLHGAKAPLTVNTNIHDRTEYIFPVILTEEPNIFVSVSRLV